MINVEKKVRTKRVLALITIGAVVIIFIILPLIFWFIFADDVTLDFELFTIGCVEDNADSITIVHLSDMHFPNYHVCLDELLERVECARPDIIAITGDHVGTGTNVAASGVEDFMARLTSIASVFYVDGNHDLANRDTRLLHNILRDSGAIVLENEGYVFQARGRNILIVGLRYGSTTATLESQAENFCFVLCLIHVPRFEVTIKAYYNDVTKQIMPNLILAGHIHGGHFRIFGRAILCPDTFFAPNYSNGLYVNGGVSMIVSRGIGNDLPIRRFNNRPHVPVIRVGALNETDN